MCYSRIGKTKGVGMNELLLQVAYSLFWIVVLACIAGVFWAIINWQERAPRNTSATGGAGMQLPIAPAQPSVSQRVTPFTPMQPSSVPVQSQKVAGTWVADTEDDAWGVAPMQSSVQTIRLSTLAQSDNILVVGQKGAGKTTLLRKIVAKRRDRGEQLIALDPHAAPGKWPCTTVGGGRDYEGIATALVQIALDMNTRFKQLARGEIAEGAFPRRATVSDEYRSIANELNGKGETIDAGNFLLSRISEGRKVGECALVACHNDTAAALGISGNTDMKTCFDYIVYMGALVDSNRTYKAPVDIKKAAKALEYPAIAWHPERNNWYVLEDDISKDEINAGETIELPSKSAERNTASMMSNQNKDNGVSLDDAVRVANALVDYKENGNKFTAIERAFNVKRGGTSDFVRARELVDAALELSKTA